MNAKSHITTFKWRHINAFPVHLSSNNSLEQCAVHAHEIVFFSREAWTVLPWRAFWIGVLNQRFKTLILPSQNKHERSLSPPKRQSWGARQRPKGVQSPVFILSSSVHRWDKHTTGHQNRWTKKDCDKIKPQKCTRSQKQESKQTNNKSAITDHAGRKNHVIDWEGTRLVARESQIVQEGSARPSGSNAHPTTWTGTGAHTSCLIFMTQWSPKRQLLAIGRLVAYFSLLISVRGRCLNFRHRNCHR